MAIYIVKLSPQTHTSVAFERWQYFSEERLKFMNSVYFERYAQYLV